jgi:hypothetical protein
MAKMKSPKPLWKLVRHPVAPPSLIHTPDTAYDRRNEALDTELDDDIMQEVREIQERKKQLGSYRNRILKLAKMRKKSTKELMFVVRSETPNSKSYQYTATHYPTREQAEKRVEEISRGTNKGFTITEEMVDTSPPPPIDYKGYASKWD